VNQDIEHLRLLSLSHYLFAGATAVLCSLPLPIETIANRVDDLGVVVMASLFMLSGWTIAVGVLLAGRFLSRRRHYTFCLAIAALLCTITPVGTVLGVFAIVVLIRPSVKLLFEPPQSPFRASV
jgi:hypothetical protein